MPTRRLVLVTEEVSGRRLRYTRLLHEGLTMLARVSCPPGSAAGLDDYVYDDAGDGGEYLPPAVRTLLSSNSPAVPSPQFSHCTFRQPFQLTSACCFLSMSHPSVHVRLLVPCLYYCLLPG